MSLYIVTLRAYKKRFCTKAHIGFEFCMLLLMVWQIMLFEIVACCLPCLSLVHMLCWTFPVILFTCPHCFVFWKWSLICTSPVVLVHLTWCFVSLFVMLLFIYANNFVPSTDELNGWLLYNFVYPSMFCCLGSCSYIPVILLQSVFK